MSWIWVIPFALGMVDSPMPRIRLNVLPQSLVRHNSRLSMPMRLWEAGVYGERVGIGNVEDKIFLERYLWPYLDQ